MRAMGGRHAVGGAGRRPGEQCVWQVRRGSIRAPAGRPAARPHKARTWAAVRPLGARTRGRCPAGAAGAAGSGVHARGRPVTERGRRVRGRRSIRAAALACAVPLAPDRLRTAGPGRGYRESRPCRRRARVGRRRGAAAVPAGAPRRQCRGGEEAEAVKVVGRGAGRAGRCTAAVLPPLRCRCPLHAACPLDSRGPPPLPAPPSAWPRARPPRSWEDGPARRGGPCLAHAAGPRLPRPWAAGLARPARRAGRGGRLRLPCGRPRAARFPRGRPCRSMRGRLPSAPPPAATCSIRMRAPGGCAEGGRRSGAAGRAGSGLRTFGIANAADNAAGRRGRGGRGRSGNLRRKACGGGRGRMPGTAARPTPFFPRPPANAKRAAPPPRATLGPALRHTASVVWRTARRGSARRAACH